MVAATSPSPRSDAPARSAESAVVSGCSAAPVARPAESHSAGDVLGAEAGGATLPAFVSPPGSSPAGSGPVPQAAAAKTAVTSTTFRVKRMNPVLRVVEIQSRRTTQAARHRE